MVRGSHETNNEARNAMVGASSARRPNRAKLWVITGTAHDEEAAEYLHIAAGRVLGRRGVSGGIRISGHELGFTTVTTRQVILNLLRNLGLGKRDVGVKIEDNNLASSARLRTGCNALRAAANASLTFAGFGFTPD